MICQHCGKDVKGVHTCSPRKMDRIIIGKYEITRLADGRLWIGPVNDGEGGVFDELDLAEVIDAFYRENF